MGTGGKIRPPIHLRVLKLKFLHFVIKVIFTDYHNESIRLE